MKKIFMNLLLFLSLFVFSPSRAQHPVNNDPQAGIEERVENLLKQMTLAEKLELLAGTGESYGFDTKANARLGIPAFKMSDGPLGVRWGKSTAFPSGVSITATWDTSLVSRFARALAEETHANGRNLLLGPCVNIHRFPAGGRNFESYGEDPWLASRMAVSYVKALQSEKVIACVKHFALNNQEWKRTEVNVVVDERTMHEIYLPAFEAAVKEGGAYSVMSAYNKVNGWWCSENKVLLTDILKNDWNFKGIVISDWVSTHETVNAANNGLDIEMPSPDVFSGEKLQKAIREGKITEATINDKIRRILRVQLMAGLFDGSSPADTAVLTSKAHKKLALELAKESIVLLKNENNLLPLDKTMVKKIAVIGPNAAIARTGGGGSSHVTPFYSISPLDGIKTLLGKDAEIIYARGDELNAVMINYIGSRFLSQPGMKGKGLKAEYFNNAKLEGEPLLVRSDSILYFNWEDNPPAPGVGKDDYSVRWTGFVTPPVSRTYTFYTASDDGVRLYINGKILIDNWTDHGNTLDSAKIDLVAGKPCDIKVEFFEHGGSAVLMLGWDLPVKKAQNTMIEEAVHAAKNADVALVFAGTSDSFESEGADRIGGLNLPGRQDELIKAVAGANPRTIVVLNTGTPVIAKSWIEKVPALIEAFFPGQEGGNAIAEILFGSHNPSGKLPFSFISSYDQSPAYQGYMDKSLEAPYAEGIFVGYRYLGKNGLKPAFPFGFGLSYTTFAYSDLKTENTGSNSFLVRLKVKNTGKLAGSETVQLYVADNHSSVPRPLRELKGFVKVFLEPQQEKEVMIPLDYRSFAYYDVTSHAWKVEPGDFELLIGSSSEDIRLKTKVSN